MWLWEKNSRIDLRFSLSTYLHSAVKNRCCTLISRNAVKGKMLSDVRLSIIEEAGAMNEVEVRELRSRLREAIAGLPPAQKEAFMKSRFEGKTYKEIAEELSVSPKTVEYRVAQAIRHLRSSLADCLPFMILVLELQKIIS